jgi:hypothetical protein
VYYNTDASALLQNHFGHPDGQANQRIIGMDPPLIHAPEWVIGMRIQPFSGKMRSLDF